MLFLLLHFSSTANPRAATRDSYIQSSTLRQTYPPNSNVTFQSEEHEAFQLQQQHHEQQHQQQSYHQPMPHQYSSLQGLHQMNQLHHAQLRNNLQYQTTGSGSIFIEDVTAATRLMRKLGTCPPASATTAPTTNTLTVDDDTGQDCPMGPTGHVLMFDDNNICIEVEWNDIRKHLVLRRVSGDTTQYTNICKQLIENIL